MTGFVNSAVKLVFDLFDFVYPPICVTCDGELEKREKYICSRCWNSFERVVMTENIIQSIESKFIIDESIDRVKSVFLFNRDARVRMAIHLLKYAQALSIADKFGLFILNAIENDRKLSNVDFVVPVPLHRARLRERGYNQSELISRGVAKGLGVPIVRDILIRTRYTETQTRLDLARRAVNVRGAFSIKKNYLDVISGKSYLIIDDVITTGATIRECGKLLKSYGASNVYAVSAAIAL